MKNRIRLAFIITALLPMGSALGNDAIKQIYDAKCSVCHVSGVAAEQLVALIKLMTAKVK